MNSLNDLLSPDTSFFFEEKFTTLVFEDNFKRLFIIFNNEQVNQFFYCLY